MHIWTMAGIGVVIVGFVVRLNPLLVIMAAALVTGWAGGLDSIRILSAFGKAFNDSRYVSIVWLVLPVIGLLEREGLQERARTLIARLRGATTGRLLVAYLALRQITAALGLMSFGGHAQMVRPLIAPMAEGAAETKFGRISARMRHLIRATAAGADNVGAFFGEDIFIAVGSILLIKGFMQESGFDIAPLDLSLWAIPTAILAFLIHGTRLLLFDRKLKRLAEAEREASE